MSWFAVTAISFQPTPVPVYIFLTTNNPIHLWLRQTQKETRKHLFPAMRRGGVLPDDLYI